MPRTPLAAAFLFATAFAAHAQVAGTQVTGTVKGPDRTGVSQASIDLINVATGATLSTVTDSAGQYSFSAVPSGTYRLQLRKSGFTTTTIRGS